MQLETKDLTKRLLEMECFKETSTKDMHEVGCSDVTVYDVIEFIRQVNKNKSHKVRGHSVVYDLCSMDYKESDYIGIDFDNSIDINGNTIKLGNAESFKIFISPSDWYDIYVYNKHGYVTLCFFPKN